MQYLKQTGKFIVKNKCVIISVAIVIFIASLSLGLFISEIDKNKRFDNPSFYRSPTDTRRGLKSRRTCYNPLSIKEYMNEYTVESIYKREEYTVEFEAVVNIPSIIVLPKSWQFGYQRRALEEISAANIMYMLFEQSCKDKNNNLNIKNKDGNLVIDMGANDGFYAMLASAYGCRVISFEPQNMCTRKLALGIAINRFEPLIDLRQFIVGVNESETMKVPANTCNGIESYENRGSRDYKDFDVVSTQAVDNIICNNESVLLWHLDVEGAEMMVLDSGIRSIKNRLIQNIIIEWMPSLWGKYGIDDRKRDELIDKWNNIIFEEVKYSCYDVDGGSIKGSLTSSDEKIKRFTSGDGDFWCTLINGTFKAPNYFPPKFRPLI